MKKTIIAAAVVIAGVITCNAQTLSPKANPTSGGYYNAGGNSLSWTMGETYNTTLSSVNNKLTQGQQQPEGNIGGGCTTAPASPIITGPNAVCGLTTGSYTATTSGATSYTWTMPTGLTITSGQTTSTINVAISAGTVSGNITCVATNSCGSSTATAYMITKKPQTPANITGPTDICGLTTATYSIPVTFGATSYTWTIPAGMTGTSTTNTITVTIANTFTSGLIKVSAVNACGSAPGTQLLVYGKVSPSSITGSLNVCGMTTATYSTPAVINANSYVWTVPATWTIASGQGTTSITANLPANVNNATFSGVVKVHAVSVCGNSADKAVTVSFCKSAITMSGAEEEQGINIYPNPTTGELRIMNDELGVKNVEVYNVLGECVFKSELVNTESEINISSLSKGMYFVRLIDGDNNVLYTQRVIKQ